jgi:hypothetical protein
LDKDLIGSDTTKGWLKTPHGISLYRMFVTLFNKKKKINQSFNYILSSKYVEQHAALVNAIASLIDKSVTVHEMDYTQFAELSEDDVISETEWNPETDLYNYEFPTFDSTIDTRPINSQTRLITFWQKFYDIAEPETVPDESKTEEPVKGHTNCFISSFDPPHMGHVAGLEAFKRINPDSDRVILVRVKPKGTPRLSEEMGKQMLRVFGDAYSDKILETVWLDSITDVVEIVNLLKQKGLYPKWIYAADDRIQDYKLRMKRDHPSVKLVKLEKTDPITGDAVMSAVESNDWETFKRIMPEELHEYFEILKIRQ